MESLLATIRFLRDFIGPRGGINRGGDVATDGGRVPNALATRIYFCAEVRFRYGKEYFVSGGRV